MRLGDALLRRLLGVALHWVPLDERDRWREEWHADLRALRNGGMTIGEGLHWVWGVWTTAGSMGLEEALMDGWTREIRHAVRGLIRQPGFTAVAVVTLGLGVYAGGQRVKLIRRAVDMLKGRCHECGRPNALCECETG